MERLFLGIWKLLQDALVVTHELMLLPTLR